MLGFKVELLDRAGNTDSATFYTERNAINFYTCAKGNGKHRGGAIVTNGQRVTDFGLMRDGTTLRDAKKALKAQLG